MTMNNERSVTPGKSSVVSDTVDRIRDRAGDAADTMKGVGAKASSTLQEVSDKAVELLGTATGTAGDKVSGALEDQKAAGAERAKSLSSAIRRAADELEDEIPPAATFIRRAADEIDAMADAVQRRDVRQLLGDLQSFARRQPAAFLGATVLGGFAVMRLLKAPTSAQGTSASPGPASLPAKSMIAGKASVPDDDVFVTGGSGDPGGISPVAPGFEPTFGSDSTSKDGESKARRS